MPTSTSSVLPQTTSYDEFQTLVKEICIELWEDPNTACFGRAGQKQNGIDVYGQPKDAGGKYRGVQCKLRTYSGKISETEIKKEVKAAKSFGHEIDQLIIFTNVPRDTKLQLFIDKLNQAESKKNRFITLLWFLDDLDQLISLFA